MVASARLADWSRTFDALHRVSVYPMAVFVALNALSLVLFAARWRRLIRSAEIPAFRRTFDFLAIGLLANAILPARPGDVIRAALLKRHGITRFSSGLASIMLERLVDVVFICLLGFGLALGVDLPPAVRVALQLFAAGATGLVIVLAILHRHAAVMERLAARVAGLPTGARLLSGVLSRMGSFAAALGVLRGVRDIGTVVVTTFMAWVALIVGVMVLLDAFHVGTPAAAAVLVVVTTNLGAAIPSSPGSIGVYHFLAVLALSVWDVDSSLAVAFAVVTHFLSIGLHITCGVIATWREGVKVGRLSTFVDSR